MTPTCCPRCGNELDDESHCRVCQAARSRRWYSENSTVASARRGVAAKVGRRITAGQREALHAHLLAEQNDRCGCCGRDVPTAIDWSIDQTTDNGMPLLRGAVCRSCKIAIGRLLMPSKFVLPPKVLDRVEAYLKRPWRDPMRILVRLGLRQNFDAIETESVADRRRADTDRTVEWLQSLGIGAHS